jgi:hypothetical protein
MAYDWTDAELRPTLAELDRDAEDDRLINGRCEDYPCCGHTPDDPCAPQDYDRPGFYDTSIPGNEHALCDHENGDCDVDYYND